LLLQMILPLFPEPHESARPRLDRAGIAFNQRGDKGLVRVS
jgi:hypothetical protein